MKSKFRKGQCVYIKRNYDGKKMGWTIGKTARVVSHVIHAFKKNVKYQYKIQSPAFKKYIPKDDDGNEWDVIYSRESELRKATKEERKLFEQQEVEDGI